MRGRAGWLGVALAAAAALRFAGLGYGLPHVFNADEPHVVNLAVSFGRGSLNPYSFKYPTLWPTALFLAYGVYFAAWSALGLKATVGQFVALYAWEPTGFYLIARGLSAAATLLGAVAVWKIEREGLVRAGASAWPWAALLLAFAPDLNVSAHAAKPDSAMFLFICLGWYFGLKVFREGARRWYWACGLSMGLAASCQYTAGATMSLLFLAHFLARAKKRAPLRWLAEGVAASGVGFLAGSPYALLDFPKFRAALGDFSYLAGASEISQSDVARQVLLNLWSFAGVGGVAGLAALIGLGLLWREDRRLALLLAGPVALYGGFLASHPDGGWMRYLFGCFPGLALLAGRGLEAFCGKRGAWAAALAGLAALGPGLYGSWAFDRELLLPDTRALAKSWIEANIAQGSTVLMDYPHASPLLRMTREELVELRGQSEAAGSPRGRLFAAMAQNHPGGGYRVLRIQRSALDLRSNPRHVALSQADAAMLDVGPGLEAARRAGVDAIVISSHGAQPGRAKELTAFFDELRAEARLVYELVPEPGVSTGPVLRIYRI